MVFVAAPDAVVIVAVSDAVLEAVADSILEAVPDVVLVVPDAVLVGVTDAVLGVPDVVLDPVPDALSPSGGSEAMAGSRLLFPLAASLAAAGTDSAGPISNWPVTGLIRRGCCLLFVETFGLCKDSFAGSILLTGLGFLSLLLSLKRSDELCVVLSFKLFTLLVLGTGLRVTDDVGGGIRLPGLDERLFD